MWRSRILPALASLMLAAAAAPAGATPRLCLPPAFDGGQRLFSLPSPYVFWLAPLLRQHELCWRRPASPDERRIVLIGNSAVYGYPLEAERTMSAVLNQR